jgi:hypothetical protein
MMGWLFLALYAFILHYFKLFKQGYIYLFWGLQATVIAMLISFPIQGYGLISILFTSMHMILSYVFIIKANKDLSSSKHSKNEVSRLFLRTSFLFLFISTLGTWALGPLMQTDYKGTAVYYAAVQFFLHFQFNGWLIFASLAILFKIFEDKGIELNRSLLKIFYRLLIISCVLTYALAVTWSTPDNFIFWTNSIGVILQFISLLVFLKIILQSLPQIKSKISAWTRFLWLFALGSFVLKMSIQAFVAIPYLAKISYTIHNFVIGFIHLIMLGVLSAFLIGVIHESTLFQRSSGNLKIGTFTIFAGILSSELILFGQGTMLWTGLGFMPYYYELIAIFSGLIVLGLLIYLLELAYSTKPKV